MGPDFIGLMMVVNFNKKNVFFLLIFVWVFNQKCDVCFNTLNCKEKIFLNLETEFFKYLQINYKYFMRFYLHKSFLKK